MAGKWVIERKCRELNRVRGVRKLAAWSMGRFWRESRGKFLITGGTEASRTWALAEKLLWDMEGRRGPTLVLSAGAGLGESLIRGVDAAGGTLWITSQAYRNYRFFGGWTPGEITRFFLQAAELMGYQGGELPLYLHGFLDILCRSYPPGLGALQALAAYDDSRIALIGRKCGADPASVDQVTHYAQAGVLFRLLLDQAAGVLSPLSAPDGGPAYSLSDGGLRQDGVYLVDIRSSFPALLHAYFAVELQRALSWPSPPRVVLSEVALGPGDPLEPVFRGALLGGGDAGASASSGTLFLGDGEQAFQTRAVLLDGGHTDGELEAALRPLGTYTHYEPVPGTGGRFFGPELEWNLNAEPGRLRVRPADTAGCQAVLWGGGGEILLVRTLR